MTRHLLKLLWNRKRASALLIAEIFCSFLACVAVATLAIYGLENWRRPLGYDYRDVWAVHIAAPEGRRLDPSAGAAGAAAARRLETLMAEIRALPPVLAVAAVAELPYSFAEDRASFDFERGRSTFQFNRVSQDLDRVLGLRLVAGRWFRPGDERLAWQPVVVNRQLAQTVFGDLDPLGRRFGKPGRREESEPEPERRVVGVIDDFRQGGELAGSGPYAFFFKPPASPQGGSYTELLLRLRPGTPAAFEDTLSRRMQAAAPDGSFVIEPLAALRESAFRLRLAPLAAGAAVAVFLLAMVGLGMVGVVWQNLLRRRREIGLRRAAGASRAAVRRQVLAEQLLLASAAMGPALLLLAQLPLLGVTELLPGRVLASGTLSAMAAIYLLVILCTLHAGAMASRVQPAEALREE